MDPPQKTQVECVPEYCEAKKQRDPPRCRADKDAEGEYDCPTILADHALDVPSRINRNKRQDGHGIRERQEKCRDIGSQETIDCPDSGRLLPRMGSIDFVSEITKKTAAKEAERELVIS